MRGPSRPTHTRTHSRAHTRTQGPAQSSVSTRLAAAYTTWAPVPRVPAYPAALARAPRCCNLPPATSPLQHVFRQPNPRPPRRPGVTFVYPKYFSVFTGAGDLPVASFGLDCVMRANLGSYF